MEISVCPKTEKAILQIFKDFEVLVFEDTQGNKFKVFSEGESFIREDCSK